jgi:hypothetical protein
MNIANIFGLHLGCKCKNDTDEFTVLGIRPDTTDGCESMYIQGEYNDLYSIKTCKLLLKPLSKMADNDKAEFIRKYVPVGDFVSRISIKFDNDRSFTVYKRRTSGWNDNTDHELNIEQSLWLAGNGYDIGIVPSEYMEIVE